ncbi:Transcription factor MafK, partial [Stegodyphus mimosarum]
MRLSKMDGSWKSTLDVKDSVIKIKNEFDFNEFSPVSPNEINDDELVSLTVRDLNRLLKMSNLSRSEVQRIKQRRRTLKNRGYAASCRNKRLEQKDELQHEHSLVQRDINILKEENRMIESELNEIKKQYESLRQYAIHSNICIPPELDISCGSF